MHRRSNVEHHFLCEWNEEELHAKMVPEFTSIATRVPANQPMAKTDGVR